MGLYKWAWKPMAGACGIPVKRRTHPALTVASCSANSALGFDRDLSIAGRVIVKVKNGDFVQKLVKIDRPSMLSRCNTTVISTE